MDTTSEPNQSRKIDTLFQQWLKIPDTHHYLSKELTNIDSSLSQEYDHVLKSFKNLVEQISDISVEVSERLEVLVPPKSPRRRKASGSGFLETIRKPSLESKKDSGISLDEHIDPLPRFYFPYGRPDSKNGVQQDWRDEIKKLFQETNEMNQQEFVNVTKACGLNRYLNVPLFQNSKTEKGVVTHDSFLKYWEPIVTTYFTDEAIAFAILKKPKNQFLTREDINVVVEDVTLSHPGLEFLAAMPVFQTRYTETVVSRLFYSKKQNYIPKMTLQEFTKSKFLDCLRNLEEVEDTQDIFSYQHFYVIYCKFWELDRDHDMMINLSCLLRYDGGSMTPAILNRVMEGCGKPLEKKGVMTYDDFIWFILSAEDKKTPQAIEYWFRCLDLDGDGIISLYELEHFYKDQYERMLCSRVSDVWKFDDYICSLMDLIKPKTPHQITLPDLKRCGSSYLFFDMIFDLRKYDSYIRRIDPMFREMDDLYIDNQDGTRTKLEGFQKFAARSYMILAEEEQSNSNDLSDDYDYNVGTDLDSGLQMDWESEEQWKEMDEDDIVKSSA